MSGQPGDTLIYQNLGLAMAQWVLGSRYSYCADRKRAKGPARRARRASSASTVEKQALHHAHFQTWRAVAQRLVRTSFCYLESG